MTFSTGLGILALILLVGIILFLWRLVSSPLPLEMQEALEKKTEAKLGVLKEEWSARLSEEVKRIWLQFQEQVRTTETSVSHKLQQANETFSKVTQELGRVQKATEEVKEIGKNIASLQELLRTPYRLEQEKMAVIIQKMVGSAHGNRFYPNFSGVARSYNFYPADPQKAEDGVVAVALGMGKTVVDGEACLRFCPRYPRHIVAFSSADDVLKNSQREFYALNLDDRPGRRGAEGVELSSYDLKVAEEDGVLAAVGSTYSPDNDVVYDGISRPGVRLVSFAPILKHGLFPLAPLLDELLTIGSRGTSSDVEIEFAVNLDTRDGRRAEMAFLQMRPLARTGDSEDLEIGHVLSSKLLCRSSSVLGSGRIADVRDVVVVDYNNFQRAKSRETAEVLTRLNAALQSSSIPYLLIGVGRWGSTDPSLGIPVNWNQIAGARVIVESGFRDFRVKPSQGTHFFQNLTSCNVGYFTVNPEAGEGFVDWEWLGAQPALTETPYARHIRFDAPLVIKMNGKSGEGVIFKPEPAS